MATGGVQGVQEFKESKEKKPVKCVGVTALVGRGSGTASSAFDGHDVKRRLRVFWWGEAPAWPRQLLMTTTLNDDYVFLGHAPAEPCL